MSASSARPLRRRPAAGTCRPRPSIRPRQRERGLLELEPAGLDLREVEHVVDDAQQRLRRTRAWSPTLRALLVARAPGARAPPSCRARRSSACGSRGSWWRGRSIWPGWRPRPRRAPPRRPPSRRRALLALLQLGDVAIDAEQDAAVGERHEVELDDSGRSACAARSGCRPGCASRVDVLAHELLDVLGRAELAALRPGSAAMSSRHHAGLEHPRACSGASPVIAVG